MHLPVPCSPSRPPVTASALIRDDADLASIPPADWDRLAGAGPLLSHAYFSALHESGCASPETGWTPRFLTAWNRSELVGAMPLYAKAHSYGEYVFDWGWADAYRRHGRRYYPKLLAAIPFTPVSGPRILAPEPGTRRALLDAALSALRRGYSSLHVLFTDEVQAREGVAAGMVERDGVQFHWRNDGYRDFADFLSAFNHDKRKKIRQERRRLDSAGVAFTRKRGREITAADWAFFFECYERTYAAHHSTPYLSLEFFERIGATLSDHLLLVLGSREGRPLCAALDVHDSATLWGRYWGTREYVPGLHFEACYYQAIEFCIERRIESFEGGAQGVHKLARGLLPAPTRSLHAIADPAFARAIADYCARERADVAHSIDELETSTPFRSGPP
ncbi:MAG TPA: GNAT family N-acetyltransferase [Casimicrobiaceae bacterium]|nr:GNAT family N-acetyltransferase [Casimicrobiaceae bacterium]